MRYLQLELPSSGVHLYENKHRDGDKVDNHYHQVYQLLYGIEGEGRIVIAGAEYHFNQHHVAIIPPQTAHAVMSDSSLTSLVLAFDHQQVIPASSRELLLRSFGQPSHQLLNPFAGSELRRLLRKMLFEQQHSDDWTNWAVTIPLQETLILLSRVQQPLQAEDANSMRAKRISHYIDTHYFDPLRTEDLAATLNIGTRQVNNIFKEQYGMTPMQYLAHVRIEVAKKLLIDSDKDIVSICFEVGYETLSSFYRAFKNLVEMSPNQYRQRQLHHATTTEERSPLEL